MNPDDQKLLELQYLAQLSPQERMGNYKAFGDRQGTLNRQMGRADALRNRKQQLTGNHVYDMLSGLGGAISGIGGEALAQGLEGQQEALTADKEKEAAGREGGFVEWLKSQGILGGSGQQPAAPQALMPGQPPGQSPPLAQLQAQALRGRALAPGATPGLDLSSLPRGI